MGYSGLGMQRWISTMKPRKFLGKRSKPDGGGGSAPMDINASSFYFLKKRKLNRLAKKKYSEKYKQELNLQLKRDRQKLIISYVISILITASLLIIFLFWLNTKLFLF